MQHRDVHVLRVVAEPGTEEEPDPELCSAQLRGSRYLHLLPPVAGENISRLVVDVELVLQDAVQGAYCRVDIYRSGINEGEAR